MRKTIAGLQMLYLTRITLMNYICIVHMHGLIMWELMPIFLKSL